MPGYLQGIKIFVPLQSYTVRLVQLVEHQIVVLGVMGSSPISHPKEGNRMAALFFFYLGTKVVSSFEPEPAGSKQTLRSEAGMRAHSPALRVRTSSAQAGQAERRTSLV